MFTVICIVGIIANLFLAKSNHQLFILEGRSHYKYFYCFHLFLAGSFLVGLFHEYFLR